MPTTNQPDDQGLARAEDFSKNIQLAYEFAQDANKKYFEYQKYFYECALKDEDIDNLQADDRPTLNFNVIRSPLLRSLKNVSDALPTPVIEPDNHEHVDEWQMTLESGQLPNPNIKAGLAADVMNDDFEQILKENDYSDQIFNLSLDAKVKSFGVMWFKAKYANDYNFDQTISFGWKSDPTKVFFDPSDKSMTGLKGEFAYELDDYPENVFVEKWGQKALDKIEAEVQSGSGSNQIIWLKNDKKGKKRITVADYYYKEYKNKKIWLDENNEVHKGKPKKGDKAVKQREIKDCTIYRVRMVGEFKLDSPKPIIFKYLPFCRMIGEKYNDEDGKIKINPIIKHVMDAQRSKNFYANFLMYEGLNNRGAKLMVAAESIQSEEQRRYITDDPNKHRSMEFNQYFRNEEGQTLELRPPQLVSPAGLPMQYLEAFSAMDGTVEKILGSEMPALGDKTLSGDALFNIAEFISGTDEPFMQNLMIFLKAFTKIIVSGMNALPNRQIGADTLPDSKAMQSLNLPNGQTMPFNYAIQPEYFHVNVTRGVNYKLQQQATVQRLVRLSEASPQFAHFLYGSGMTFLLKNMDLNDKDKFIAAYEEHIAEQEKEAKENPPPPNPDLINAEANMNKSKAAVMTAAAKQSELPLKEQEVAQKAQAATLQYAGDQKKAHAEEIRAKVDHSIKIHDMKHRHNMDAVNAVKDVFPNYYRSNQNG